MPNGKTKTEAEMERNHNFLGENLEKLRKKYPGEYVAVFRGKVVYHSPNIDELNKKLYAGITIEQSEEILVEYIETPLEYYHSIIETIGAAS